MFVFRDMFLTSDACDSCYLPCLCMRPSNWSINAHPEHPVTSKHICLREVSLPGLT